MTSRRQWMLAALALALSCGHNHSTLRAPRVHRVWPDPPAPARVRWAAEFPDPNAPIHEGPSIWSRAFNAVVGVETSPTPVAPTLSRPFGIAAVEGGFVVADPDGRQVIQVQWPSSKARSVECSDRRWLLPMGVTTGPDGSIYVADSGAGAIVRVDRDGACRVIGNGRLERPVGVAFVNGRVYAVDPPKHRIVAFTPAGKQVARFGVRGDDRTEGLNFPTGIAATADGELLVVDALNFRVCRFSADGRFLGSFGARGTKDGGLGRPKAVTVDGSGNIYVSDAYRDVVSMFTRDGEFQMSLGGSGSGPGDLTLPAGVVVQRGYLFVADSYNRRVGIYELLEEAL